MDNFNNYARRLGSPYGGYRVHALPGWPFRHRPANPGKGHSESSADACTRWSWSLAENLIVVRLEFATHACRVSDYQNGDDSPSYHPTHVPLLYMDFHRLVVWWHYYRSRARDRDFHDIDYHTS